MRTLTAYLAFTVIVLTFSFAFIILSFASKNGTFGFPDFKSVKDVTGLQRFAFSDSFNANSVKPTNEVGIEARQDNFAVALDTFDSEINYEEKEEYELVYEVPDFSNLDADMVYRNAFSEEPLFPQDYYYRKFENAVAGVNGVNKMPIIKAGDSYGVIRDKFINIKTWNGYVQPPGYYFASGVCWTSSMLGFLQDNSNKLFREKYGVDLFVFGRGDRGPHPDYYRTYNGRGYTIMQLHEGVPLQDYRFTVNPALKNMPELADIKMKIVMFASTVHPTASHGQSLGGYILSNKEF